MAQTKRHPDELTNFQRAELARLKRHAAALKDGLDSNLPIVIVSLTVWQLFIAAMGYCGQDLTRELGNWIVKNIKTGAGFCHNRDCDNGIPTALTHPPVCEACEKESADLAQKYGDLSGGDGL